MANAQNNCVLIVEDDKTLAAGLQRSLQRLGMSAEVANDGTSALERLSAGSYGVIVLDLGLPDMDGIDILATLRSTNADGAPVPVLVMTAAEPSALHRLDRSMVKAVVFKPLDLAIVARYVQGYCRGE